MSPYKLITGTDKNITDFETKIATALQEGYEIATDLVVQLKSLPNGDTETLLFQAMICDEALDVDEDEYEDDDEEEVDEYEEQQHS